MRGHRRCGRSPFRPCGENAMNPRPSICHRLTRPFSRVTSSGFFLPQIDGRADDEIYARELKQLVSELGLEDSVTFAGPVPRGELPEHYRRCAVHVNLTPAGFGDKVAWEAMSCGRPCLVANDDFRETLDRYEKELLFRGGDPT